MEIGANSRCFPLTAVLVCQLSKSLTMWIFAVAVLVVVPGDCLVFLNY